MDDVDVKRLARMTLCAMADRACAKGMSAAEWEDSVIDTPQGRLLGEKEVSAIGSFVFVKNASRRHG